MSVVLTALSVAMAQSPSATLISRYSPFTAQCPTYGQEIGEETFNVAECQDPVGGTYRVLHRPEGQYLSLGGTRADARFDWVYLKSAPKAGAKIEWMFDGEGAAKPSAAILRHVTEDAGANVEFLAVYGLRDSQAGCLTAAVMATGNPAANEQARVLASGFSKTFRCGVDQVRIARLPNAATEGAVNQPGSPTDSPPPVTLPFDGDAPVQERQSEVQYPSQGETGDSAEPPKQYLGLTADGRLSLAGFLIITFALAAVVAMLFVFVRVSRRNMDTEQRRATQEQYAPPTGIVENPIAASQVQIEGKDSDLLGVIASSVQAVGSRDKVASKLKLKSTRPILIRAVLVTTEFNGTISGELGTEHRAGDKREVFWRPHMQNLQRRVSRLEVILPADMDAVSRAMLWTDGVNIAGASPSAPPQWMPNDAAQSALGTRVAKDVFDNYVGALPGARYHKRNFKYQADLDTRFRPVEFSLVEVRFEFGGKPFVGYVEEASQKYFGQSPVDSSVAIAVLLCVLAAILIVGGGLAIILTL